MAYPSFPNIQKPSYQYNVEPEDPGICTTMENGSQISRPRFTKSRLSFSYHWNGLPAADAKTLINFYQNTAKGCSQIFTWVDSDPDSPFYNQTFNVRFKYGSVPKLIKVGPGRYSTEVEFMEA